MSFKERMQELAVVLVVGLLMAALVKGVILFVHPCSMGGDGFSLGHVLIAGCYQKGSLSGESINGFAR